MQISQSLRAALSLLSKRDRWRLAAVVVLQSSLALMDLAAVALIGLVTLLAAGTTGGGVPPLVDSLERSLGLEDASQVDVAVGLAILAGVLMISKSILSFAVTRRVFKFLANRQAMISSSLASRLLTRPLLDVQARSSQDLSYALTSGVNALTLGVIGQGTILMAEISLLAVLALGLLFIDPVVTVFTVAFFALVGFGLHWVLAGWAARLGRKSSHAQIASIESVQELVATYREIAVAGRRGLYVQEFANLRWDYAHVQANLQVMSQVSKYVFEVALIVGAAMLAASQFITRDTAAAVAIIAVFLAAASRVMPSLLRLQSAALGIRTQAGVAAPALTLADELASAESSASEVPDALGVEVRERLARGLREGFEGFDATVVCANAALTYPGASEPAVQGISITIPAATSFALVGSTGAGKSTLVDLMLGVLRADSGSIVVSGLEPTEAVLQWPGAVAYVPQDTMAVNGDVRRNVALGIPPELVDEDRLWEALERAHLAEFLQSERAGLDTLVGEHGIRLSGGQRQRLGIARALYTRPRLLVLDEATSALDSETEEAIARTLKELSGQVTLVLVAHRLATIRTASQVAFLQDGRLEGLGTFDEVRHQVIAFDRQARLLGL